MHSVASVTTLFWETLNPNPETPESATVLCSGSQEPQANLSASVVKAGRLSTASSLSNPAD